MSLSIEGTIRSTDLSGISPQDFFTWMDGSLTYVIPRPALNLAGEARGRIILR